MDEQTYSGMDDWKGKDFTTFADAVVSLTLLLRNLLLAEETG